MWVPRWSEFSTTGDEAQAAESLRLENRLQRALENVGERGIAGAVVTATQATLLDQLKCDEFQGFLTSKPVPPEEVRAPLGKRS